MDSLIDNPVFQADYRKLATVGLNPKRHTAPNALIHCEWVVERVDALAALNDCSPEERRLLRDLAYVHDIGKTTGSAAPAKSVEMLPRYGVLDDVFVNLVKYHDINLPWYLSAQKGEPPGAKAWARLARHVSLRLLCLFMIADRVDCPGGWQANAALVWFLDQCRCRGLLPDALKTD